MTVPHWDYEKKLADQGYRVIAGVDEVGRGAWAGPLAAAAVVLPLGCRIPGVRDSKLLPKERREDLAEKIMEKAIAWSIAMITVETIDECGLGAANLLALRQAVESLSIGADYVLSDAFDLTRFGLSCTPVIHGDARVFSIAAASILAKVHRDRRMEAYAEDFPMYGFERHRGYGTPEHQEALRLFGPSALHRRSFEPIRAYVERAHNEW